MAKIETIKNEYVEFKVFAAAKVFTLFQALHHNSLFEHITSKPHDMKAYCDALLFGHKAACLLLDEKQQFEDSDYLLDRLSADDAAKGVADMLGIKLGLEETADSDKKK